MFIFFSLKNEVARPRLPTRPRVRVDYILKLLNTFKKEINFGVISADFLKVVACWINIIKHYIAESIKYLTCTSDTVNILVNIRGHVKVNNMLYIWNIQTTSSNCCSYQDGVISTLKCLEGKLV